MAHRRATVYKYIRIGPDDWRYAKPAYSANGKIKPHVVIVGNRTEIHTEGNYYLRLHAGKGLWRKIGPNAADAERAAQYEESLLTAIARGIPVSRRLEEPKSLAGTLWGFLEDYKLSQRPESYNLMKQTLGEFVEFNKKSVIADITRVDLLKYKQWLVNRGRTVRTAGNKMLRVNQYLRSIQGLEPGKGLVTTKDAKFVQLEPEVYTPEELALFFAACTPFQFLVFKTYLMSGLRKQELENLEWTDINFSGGIIKVRAKPGWLPKTWEEREIEVADDLLDMLRKAERRGPRVFANTKGNKYTHSWDDCQSIGKRAKVAAHPHKFRATYATKLLQSGVDIKTVQKLLGHKTIEATMRYLSKARSPEVRAKMNMVWKAA